MTANGPGFLVGGETKAGLEELLRRQPGSTNGGGSVAPPIQGPSTIGTPSEDNTGGTPVTLGTSDSQIVVEDITTGLWLVCANGEVVVSGGAGDRASAGVGVKLTGTGAGTVYGLGSSSEELLDAIVGLTASLTTTAWPASATVLVNVTTAGQIMFYGRGNQLSGTPTIQALGNLALVKLRD